MLRRTLFLSLVGLLLHAFPSAAQQFGGTVVTSGSQVLASDSGNRVSAGSVYVFEAGGDDSWMQHARLQASDASAMVDGFGRAVAVDGATMVVGAPDASAIYVFARSEAGTWMETQKISHDAASFGRSVAIHDHMIVVGATDGAYGYHRTDAGEWVPVGALTVSVDVADSGYGSSVSVEGMQALVGAPASNDRAGEAYTFLFEDGSWVETGALPMPGRGDGASFGAAVLLHHGNALVGAPGYESRIGAVGMYAWDGEARSWSFTRRFAPPMATGNEGFGASIAYSEHTFYIGAPTANRAEGAVHLFEASNHMQTWRHAGTLPADLQTRNLFGLNVSVTAGVAVAAAPMYDNGEGAAVIFARAEDGTWSQQAAVYAEAEGGYESITGDQVTCDDGKSAAWTCQDVDMQSFLTVEDIGGQRGTRTNDIWGWTDPETNREYALVGRTDGTSFVDVTDAGHPVYLGNMDRTDGAPPSVWRDIKVYKDHAFIVADGAGEHGMQVFDLARLRNVENAPVEFEPDFLYDGIASSHNIVINEETGFAYAVGNRMGGETCGGGLHMIDISNPKVPTFAGCFAHEGTGRSGTGTTHDAQCVVYRGPDADHAGREICLGSNETALSIADVTDKSNPTVISIASYPAIAYTHQGWLTEDQRFFFINDEGDEPQGLVEGTRTLIFDLEDLDDPVLVGEHISTETTTDHNLYVRGNLMYQSNYESGLRILDVSDPENPVEVAFFDTVPNDATGGGSWSNYPYFESGTIVVTSGREGLFMLKKREVDL